MFEPLRESWKAFYSIVIILLHMSQNNYSIGIVQALLKKPNHIRGLAKELKTNQTTVSRKVAELYKDNAVDFRPEGKNKVFFLKKTLEAKEYAYLAEIRRQIEAVKAYPRLRTVFERIRQNDKIALAILFGSYAKGAATKESDIDIFLETKDRKAKEETELIDSKISVKLGEYDSKNLLVKEIEKDHIVIKGIEGFYEKSQFFA